MANAQSGYGFTVYRFLLSPRWLRLIAGALLAAAVCVALGLWQLDRLAQRHARNDLIRTAERTAPQPLDRLLEPARPLPKDLQWRQIRATGRYDSAHVLVVRNRPFHGAVGFHELVPLVTRAGAALLVDRGWVPGGTTAAARPDLPPLPPGVVTVVARVRRSERADGGPAAPTGQVRRIDIPAITRTVPYPLYGGYAEAVHESPAPRRSPDRLPPPEPSEGPHLLYAVQWFLFAAGAVVGVGVLARREAESPAQSTTPPVRTTAARY